MRGLLPVALLPAVLLLAAFVLAAGCAPWPEHGRGGWAESGAGPTRSNTLADRLRCAENHLAGLEVEQPFQPAALHDARIQWARAARTVSGGLQADAEVDLDRLDVMLSRFNAQITECLS